VPERYRALILATFGSLRWGSWCPAQPVGGCAARNVPSEGVLVTGRIAGGVNGPRQGCAFLSQSLTYPVCEHDRGHRPVLAVSAGSTVENQQAAGDQAPDKAVEPGHPGRVGTGATGCGSQWCHWSRNALPEPGEHPHGDRSCRGGTVWLRSQHPAGLQEAGDHYWNRLRSPVPKFLATLVATGVDHEKLEFKDIGMGGTFRS
jgi:hypothetical protein